MTDTVEWPPLRNPWPLRHANQVVAWYNTMNHSGPEHRIASIEISDRNSTPERLCSTEPWTPAPNASYTVYCTCGQQLHMDNRVKW